jgi:hypothetical protein
VALDGDLLIDGSNQPSETELVIRTIGARLELSDAQIRGAGTRRRGGFRADFAIRAPIGPGGRSAAGPPVPRAMVRGLRSKARSSRAT